MQKEIIKASDKGCIYCDGQVMWKQYTTTVSGGQIRVEIFYYCKYHGDCNKMVNEGTWERFVGNVPKKHRAKSGALKSM